MTPDKSKEAPDVEEPLGEVDFTCRRCGICCTGLGYVNLSDEECRRIARFLEMPLDRFLAQYTRYKPGYERWLVDGKGEDDPCVFLFRDAEGFSGCRLEGEAKPLQCREFPMKWRRADAETWCRGLMAAANVLKEGPRD